MTTYASWKTGAAFGLTAAISYTVCTALYAIWPDAGIDFLNALFHGLDFRQLGTPQPMTVTMFLSPLFVLTAWSFVVGSLFGWLQQAIGGKR